MRQNLEKCSRLDHLLQNGTYALTFPIPLHVKNPSYSKDQKNLGTRLRARRIEAGLTVKEFGKKIGVSETIVIAWEKHNVKPSHQNVRKLERFFGGIFSPCLS